MNDAQVRKLVAAGDWPTINELLRDGWITKRQVMEADEFTSHVDESRARLRDVLDRLAEDD